MNIEYATNRATPNEILDHFHSCDEVFLSALKEKVDLNFYAEKIFNKAHRFEAFDVKLVGLMAFYYNSSEDAFLTNLSVNSTYQGCGIATHLFNLTLDYLRKANIKKVCLEVDKTNLQAIKLHKKMGFEVWEEKKASFRMQVIL